jgi:hypothetical protein
LTQQETGFKIKSIPITPKIEAKTFEEDNNSEYKMTPAEYWEKQKLKAKYEQSQGLEIKFRYFVIRKTVIVTVQAFFRESEFLEFQTVPYL